MTPSRDIVEAMEDQMFSVPESPKGTPLSAYDSYLMDFGGPCGRAGSPMNEGDFEILRQHHEQRGTEFKP